MYRDIAAASLWPIVTVATPTSARTTATRLYASLSPVLRRQITRHRLSELGRPDTSLTVRFAAAKDLVTITNAHRDEVASNLRELVVDPNSMPALRLRAADLMIIHRLPGWRDAAMTVRSLLADNSLLPYLRRSAAESLLSAGDAHSSYVVGWLGDFCADSTVPVHDQLTAAEIAADALDPRAVDCLRRIALDTNVRSDLRRRATIGLTSRDVDFAANALSILRTLHADPIAPYATRARAASDIAVICPQQAAEAVALLLQTGHPPLLCLAQARRLATIGPQYQEVATRALAELADGTEGRASASARRARRRLGDLDSPVWPGQAND